MKTYSDYLQRFFPGIKVQKISVNAGFSCPNRDGTIATGGCCYCRVDSFSPAYCIPTDPVSVQVENGKRFFSRKYPDMKYLAYFQSYTNTHARNPQELRSLYKEALDCEGVVGLVVGTRPDTLPDPILDMLAKINCRVPVFLEIGAESAHDTTLSSINRHHTWSDVKDSVERAATRGLHCGLHLIAGLPGESKEMILESVEAACSLPIDTLKLHQLQIIKDTPLCRQWEKGEVDVIEFSVDDYLALCEEIINFVPDSIVIERFLAQSPPQLVVSPKWGLKNYQFMNLLEQRIKIKNEFKNKPDNLKDNQISK